MPPFFINTIMDLIQTLNEQANIIRGNSQYYEVGKDKIEIKPITVGQVISISPHLNKITIDEDIESPGDFFDKIVPKISEYMTPIKSIFDELIDYNIDDLLPVDIVNILLLVIHQMDTKSFQTSIIFLKKISRNSREIIARAEQNFSTR
jgi:hypothetical protein